MLIFGPNDLGRLKFACDRDLFAHFSLSYCCTTSFKIDNLYRFLLLRTKWSVYNISIKLFHCACDSVVAYETIICHIWHTVRPVSRYSSILTKCIQRQDIRRQFRRQNIKIVSRHNFVTIFWQLLIDRSIEAGFTIFLFSFINVYDICTMYIIKDRLGRPSSHVLCIY